MPIPADPMQTHDPVMAELERDVSRVLAHTGVHCLGLDAHTNVDAIAHIVERNLHWMHRTHDWFKLVGLFATKKLLQLIHPNRTPAITDGFSCGTTMDMQTTGILPFVVPPEAGAPQPEHTEADSETAVPDAAATVSTDVPVVVPNQAVVQEEGSDRKRKRTAKPKVPVLKNTDTDSTDEKVTEPKVKKAKSTTPRKRSGPPPHVKVIDVDQAEEPVAEPGPLSPPPTPAMGDASQRDPDDIPLTLPVED